MVEPLLLISSTCPSSTSAVMELVGELDPAILLAIGMEEDLEMEYPSLQRLGGKRAHLHDHCAQIRHGNKCFTSEI